MLSRVVEIQIHLPSVCVSEFVRLLVPVKLGLKNVKAITKITYSAEEPKDYWAERGYSRYDGI
jgi:DMSO/TMAO reductase YedYZ molybdopterin-dependent catalytic subunit